ncbi:hypothetical protein AYI68_g4357 [Smittium mucronatum]|uniref:Pentatricopeptide repeat-containing protein n=1 Tax=Smittium mucronatum TaxID=133383 RepID=A0A1R0GXB3_9FUNG|nr:hypothetical protein AYI68_g4357 [Smittium mucronatum]
MFANLGDTSSVTTIFEEMLSKDILPSSSLVNVIIFLLIKNNKLQEAMEFWSSHQHHSNRYLPCNLYTTANLGTDIVQDIEKDSSFNFGDEIVNYMESDFLIARQIAPKLISSCLDRKLEILPFYKKCLNMKLENFSTEENRSNRVRILSATYLILDFNRQYPNLFNGALGTKVFNNIFKYAIKHYHRYSNNDENYEFEDLFLREFSFGLFYPLWDSLKTSHIDEMFVDGLLSFYGLGDLNEGLSRNEFGDFSKAKNGSNTKFVSNINLDLDTARKLPLQNGDSTSLQEELINNQKSFKKAIANDFTENHKLAIRVCSILVFHTLTRMISSKVTPDFNILTHSLPSILLLDKSSKSLDLIFYEILRSTNKRPIGQGHINNKGLKTQISESDLGLKEEMTTTDAGSNPGTNNFNPNEDKMFISQKIYIEIYSIAKKWEAVDLVENWLITNNIFVCNDGDV